MTPISLDCDQRVQQLLRHCGQYAEQMADKQFEVFEKGPDDYVTNIDRVLDQKLSTAFSEMFPADGIITEEDAQSRQKFHAGYDRLWCIDPIDGTEDFIHRKRDYAVMAGLLQNYQPIAGWIYAPAYDRAYHGGVQWGVFQTVANYRSEPIVLKAPPSPTAGFCPILIGHRDQARFGQAIAHLIPEAQFYSLGSFGLKVIEVILGRAGLYLYCNGRVKLWDTVGPLALAQAAGLVCCDLDGRPLGFSPRDIDSATLAHTQPILIGWSEYVDLLRPKLQAAIATVQLNFGT